MIKINRDQFLEQGFVILRHVIPPSDLEELRHSYETLVDRQRLAWTAAASPTEPSGGKWEIANQPRLIVNEMAAMHDAQTASTIEFWLRENIQGVSSHLLAEADVPPTEMMLMCNPVSDRGPAAWHRDFYPPLNCPLMAYADDIKESGPRYVQWNIPLYDDNVLWVVPGSHIRPNTQAENESMRHNLHSPIPGAIQTHLRAGDGVAYILPILHWGSNYSTKMRRTIHGGFARLTHWESTSWIQHLSQPAQDTYSRWYKRSGTYLDYAVAALRAVIEKDVPAYHAALNTLHPGRGEKGIIKSTICLSKTARYIYNQQCRDLESLSPPELQCMEMVHPMTLQWGLALGKRFTPDEARLLWQRFKPVDDIVQTDVETYLPGFQGPKTHYLFATVPAQLTTKSWISSWESGYLT